MSEVPQVHVHGHDAGLPAGVIAKRRSNRAAAYWMLAIALVTAIPGWTIYGRHFSLAVRERPDSFIMVVLAWLLLIVSSVTLVLGLWYLLLAQVRRMARMTGEGEMAIDAEALRCNNCGWRHDGPDRFCRHCGKPLGTTIVARPP